MKRTYTEAIHAKRLIKILESKGGPCNKCPAARFYSSGNGCSDMWKNYTNYPCDICFKFVGGVGTVGNKCPCHWLDDPVKTSWLALEEKGYI